MSPKAFTRRDALRLAAATAATSPLLMPRSAAAQTAVEGLVPHNQWVADGWAIKPFALNQVSLREGIHRQKRDRILNFTRNYPGTGGVLDGPQRALANFRTNAGLPTGGFQAPGAWDNATANLRGHWTGHFMSGLAQCYADTGEQVYKDKLDYIVAELGTVQKELDKRALGRVDAQFGGRGIKLGGPNPNQYVRLPTGIVSGNTDLTIAAWVKPSLNQNTSRVFDFGSSSNTYMTLLTRVSNTQANPRFGIRAGSAAEQQIVGTRPLPAGQWSHVAVVINSSDRTGTLYVNGEEAGVNANLTLSPASLGNTTNNYVGRSQATNTDPYLDGIVDELQIHAFALDADAVRNVMSASGSEQPYALYGFEEEGQTAIDGTGMRRDGSIVGAGYTGFLAAYPEGQFIRLEPPTFQTNDGPNAVWAVWYTFHKILRGLLDAHELTANTRALEIAFPLGDWAFERLSRLARADLDRMWNIYSAGEAGGANEVLAELSALAPDPERKANYLAAAKTFDFTTMLTATLENRDILNGRHGNTFIPPVSGQLRIYEQTGETNYLTAAKNFWGMVVPHRVWANGGTSGPGEYFAQRGVIARHLRQATSTTAFAETCTAANMLRLSRNLFFHTGDPAYMDYYEKNLFNQILGSKRDIDNVQGPWVTYHQNLFPGASRQPDWTRYVGNNGVGSCCTGTGLENHTKYQESIYFTSADESALYVNLYIPSVLRWVSRGFEIEQATQYPQEGAATFTVVSGRGALDFKLRVPAWVRRGFTVTVNGAPRDVAAAPGTYVTVGGNWAPGDVIRVSMPFSFRTERTPDDPMVQSLHYGPSLMVTYGPAAPPIAWRQLSFYKSISLDTDLRGAFTDAGGPLHFSTHGFDVAPFHIADPGGYQAYHAYFERIEPEVVFGSNASGVPNRKRADNLTFLDVVWDRGPFATQGALVGAVTQVANDFAFSASERDAVVAAASAL